MITKLPRTTTAAIIAMVTLAVVVVALARVVGNNSSAKPDKQSQSNEDEVLGVTHPGSSGGGPPIDPPGPPDNPPGNPPGTPPGNPPTNSPPAGGHDPKVFYISGDFSGVFPGFDGDLTLELTNPQNFSIDVTELEATVTGVDKPNCPPSDLVVDSWSDTLTIPPKETETQTLDMRMKATSGDPCQGARFSISYGGKAVMTR